MKRLIIVRYVNARLAAFVSFIYTKAKHGVSGKSGKKIVLESEADFEKIPSSIYFLQNPNVRFFALCLVALMSLVVSVMTLSVVRQNKKLQQELQAKYQLESKI